MKISKKRFSVSIAILTISGSLLGPVSAANLVVNGGFEDTTTSGTLPVGWSHSGVSVTTPPYAYTGNTFVPPNEGSWALDLGPSGIDSEGGGTIEQTIDNISPGAYEFSFAYAIEYNTSTSVKADFSFSISGVVIDSQTFNDVAGAYKTFTGIYTATNQGSITISFTDIVGNGHPYDAIIDSVSLVAVPEPSSVLLLGMASFPLILRRKRS